MRHRVAGRKLSRHTQHRELMFRNMLVSLLQYERIKTTLAKGKELRSWADRIISLGKKGTLHARRRAFALLRDKGIVKKLFDEIAPKFKDRRKKRKREKRKKKRRSRRKKKRFQKRRRKNRRKNLKQKANNKQKKLYHFQGIANFCNPFFIEKIYLKASQPHRESGHSSYFLRVDFSGRINLIHN